MCMLFVIAAFDSDKWTSFIIIITRSHCSTTYVDAAYCYRQSSGLSVDQSVCLSVTICKNGWELIEILFGLWTRVGPMNHVVNGDQHPHVKGQFGGRRDDPLWSIGTLCRNWDAIWVVDLAGPKEPCIKRGSRSRINGYFWGGKVVQFWGKRASIVKHRDFLPWAVQKRLNVAICHFSCGCRWAQGSTSSIVFARWRQCASWRAHWRHLANTIEPSVCCSDAVLCQITLTTCYY